MTTTPVREPRSEREKVPPHEEKGNTMKKLDVLARTFRALFRKSCSHALTFEKAFVSKTTRPRAMQGEAPVAAKLLFHAQWLFSN